MSHFDPRTRTPSGQLLAMLLVVIVAASVGFGLGHEARGNQLAHFGVPIAPAAAAAVGYAVLSIHDESVPDTAATLGQERLHDDESAPTF